MPRTSLKQAADVIRKKRPQERLSSPLRRALTLAALLIACAVVYGIILSRFDLSKGAGETELGAPAGQARVNLYLQPIQIDAVNESMQVRISVVPLSDAKVTIADHDFLLKIQRGKQVELVQIRAGQSLPEVTYDFDLHDGNVRDYPLDRYISLMALAANERAQDGAGRPLPIHVTVWEEASLASMSRPGPSPRNSLMNLRFSLRSVAQEQFRSLALPSMPQCS